MAVMKSEVAQVRHCLVEAATQRELEARVAEMEEKGWRTIDGRTIASPTRSAPYWVQVLYQSEEPIPLEVVRINPASFDQRPTGI
jgi:hypothetical protein